MEITIPHNYAPRDYQLPLLKALDSGVDRAFCLWHRRSGKDVTLWNLMIKKAFERVGVYFYLLPTYVQAKKIIWDGITNDGWKMLDYIPDALVEKKNGQELKIELKNGSIIQLIGTDKYDSIRGTNPVGCVFSEYAFQHPMAWEVIKPILRVNKGWAVFNTTPNGKNHSYDLHMAAEGNDKWFVQTLGIHQTGVVDEEDIDEERRSGMTEDMIQQEYYCSYEVGRIGSVYGKQLEGVQERVCKLPVLKDKPVDLFLDLGRADSTAIIFMQRVGKELRVIDFIEENGRDVGFYVKELLERKYWYGNMWLPHDAFNKRMESAKTIAEQFQEGGFKIKHVPKSSIANGIMEGRKIMPYVWFDEDRTINLLKALENYHYEYNQRRKMFTNNPLHDWSSHAADAFRYMAVSIGGDAVTESYESQVSPYLEDSRRKYIVPGLGVKATDYGDYTKAAQEYLN